MTNRLLLSVLLLGLLIAFLACSDEFAPFRSDPPITDPPIIILSTPDSVYVQLQRGIASHRIEAYINAFNQDFRLFPDPQDSVAIVNQTGNPDALSDWDRTVEEEVHRRIFLTFANMQLTFLGSAIDSSATPNEVLLTKEYRLTADDRVFEGRFDWRLVRLAGEWRISLWIDQGGSQSGNPSWTYLRGEFR